MPHDGDATVPPRRRSRTVRAAALVTLGLGAAGCDETPPPDLPGQTEARLDACRAAHRRLGEDPARCDVLEQVVAREHGAARPHFVTIAACEATFGRDACEGETLAATGPNWRPVLAGWSRAPEDQRLLHPVVQDRSARYWALREPALPAGSGIATQPAPRNVETPDLSAATRTPIAATYAYYRLAPIYPDEATCAVEWQACERSDLPLPNRFATRDSCRATWTQCVEVELPESALTMTVADSTPPQEMSGARTSGTASRAGWWIGYNSGYRQGYSSGIGPRYQGWTWTADRTPTAAYRPAVGTGPLQAWDSGTRRLAAANRMGVYSSGSGSRVSGTTISRPTSTISRAGFGSTGRAYSSGG
ncbi:DUF1190 domain-containing protein [Neoroseomonas soli]|uniref:DUF1190 domain-containing protein n=1 Tax=Neoroseomonas soli TaxID=1081025 RepID=A0A9X9WTG0_9PROT|nr:DUF1190 domain-containing protein [Neoroseomonas soli]MBR0670439.1 DUF1190 domain-containing protein [Neoroseomonas soli]